MIRGAPAGGAVGSLTPADELPPTEEPTPEPARPILPVVPAELDPTVPVTGAGIPALPVPVPKLGVTVVLPGPLPPGMPAPDGGTWAGVPGCPGPDDVDVPGDVPPVLPALPAPPAPPPPPLDCAKATAEARARNSAVVIEVRTGMAISCNRIVPDQRLRLQVRSGGCRVTTPLKL